MKSWKTTLFGLLAAAGGAILGAYELKPELLAGFPKWLPGIGLLASCIGTACVGLAARDNNVTSEQAGAAPVPSTGTLRSVVLPAILAIGLAGVIVGCAGTPARIAYNTVAAPAITVDQAMKAWGDYVGQFHPPVATELKVKAAFERYQATELLAIDAAKAFADLSASGNTNSLGARVQAELTSQAASTALTDLVSLLQNIGVKL